MAINPDLLTILACPKCREAVSLTDDREGLACAACKKVYPIRDDIPVMLIEEAIPAEQWAQGVRSVKG